MEEKKKHSHAGHRQRLKEKAVKAGIEHWPEHEVLELLLMYAIPQKDVNPLAHELIDKFGSIAGVLDAGYKQLEDVKGIGSSAATLLSLLPDMFSRYNTSKNKEPIILDTTYKCVKYFNDSQRVKSFEQFYVFCLNAKKKLINTTHIDSALASAVTVPIKDFAHIVAQCKAIVVVHTHPGGDSHPTQTDIIATERLMRVCNTLGVSFDDHIVIAENEYYSMAHSGILRDIDNHIEYGTPLPVVDKM